MTESFLNSQNFWLNIHKPKGITSFDVVRKLKPLLKPLKIGHGGTLDPMAEGVLPIAVGHATKTIYRFNDAKKTYQFEILWGTETDTFDLEGKVVAQNDICPSLNQIDAVLPLFKGEIMQTPPNFSACKVNGKRAYDKARNGEIFELEPKKIVIDDIKIISHKDNKTYFEVLCGKGTYIRAICRDIAAKLGVFGTVSVLKRMHVGPFNIDDAQNIDNIDLTKQIKISDLYDNVYQLNAQEYEDIKHGRFISSSLIGEVCCVYEHRVCAIGVVEGNVLKPKNVFLV